ncbi:MAG TPA: helix-hairpin-helix domain-containing protein [Gemmatimonadales bacterium]|nr:helix-hairpin-helix domain-containing protein [Gemmatimonadales bacterium]
MPPPERRALLLLLALAVAGQGVRYLLTKPGEPAGGVQLLATLGAESPLAQRDSAMRQGRPLAQDEHINVDLAPAAELARLPRVGPRLAKTIVADRQAHGPFGSLEGLDRVAGIGPGLLKTIGPHVVFSGARRCEACLARGSAPPESSGDARPSAGSGQAVAPTNINTASLAELDALPGIGPAKARAILRYREEHGGFATIEGLAGVPGLTRAVLARLKERVVVH